jgi:serine/threonine-protein kinase HipA
MAQAFARYSGPSALYIVDRFDRTERHGRVQRLHMIDACQLLNKARNFKYAEATVETLAQAIGHVRTRTPARLWLFQWLLFNALTGNSDNHLKNVSFMVSADGIGISPGYDLLSTAVYTTKAFAHGRATWPDTALALPLPGARTYAEITRPALLDAGHILGLNQATATRELDRMVQAFIGEADKLIAAIAADSAQYPDAVRPALGGEMHVLRAIRHVVIGEMVKKLTP